MNLLIRWGKPLAREENRIQTIHPLRANGKDADFYPKWRSLADDEIMRAFASCGTPVSPQRLPDPLKAILSKETTAKEFELSLAALRLTGADNTWTKREEQKISGLPKKFDRPERLSLLSS